MKNKPKELKYKVVTLKNNKKVKRGPDYKDKEYFFQTISDVNNIFPMFDIDYDTEFDASVFRMFKDNEKYLDPKDFNFCPDVVEAYIKYPKNGNTTHIKCFQHKMNEPLGKLRTQLINDCEILKTKIKDLKE